MLWKWKFKLKLLMWEEDVGGGDRGAHSKAREVT